MANKGRKEEKLAFSYCVSSSQTVQVLANANIRPNITLEVLVSELGKTNSNFYIAFPFIAYKQKNSGTSKFRR